MKHSTTQTLINALRIIAHDIPSDECVVKAAIAEAAQRLEELEEELQEAIEIIEFSGVDYDEVLSCIEADRGDYG